MSEVATNQVLNCLNDLGFTLDCPQLHDTTALFAGLEEFRQHLGGRLTLTMLTGIGQPVDVHEVNVDVMKQAIETVRQFQRTAAKSASFS